MTHVTDIDLIELTADRLNELRRAEVERHLAVCEDCRRRQAETSTVWTDLSAWQVDASGRDIASTVRANVLRQAAAETGTRRWRAARVARVAASLLLAAGIGHAAARVNLHRQVSPSPGGIYAQVDEEVVSDALYLYELGSPSATGLPSSLLDPDDSSSDEEGQP